VSEEGLEPCAADALNAEAQQGAENEALTPIAVGTSFTNLPHPRALAFLGDAVYEIFLREWAVEVHGGAQSRDLHGFTVTLARASAQVALLHHLQAELTAEELEIIRQGRNVGVGSSRRAEQATHRQATGFEALLGALHLQQPQRLVELFALARPFLQAHWEAQQK
jgi:ribonuclease-3 family protein